VIGVPVRLVLFDMDDTLFDHSLTCRAALRQIRAEESGFRTWPLEELWGEYRRLLDSQSPKLSAAPRVYADLRAERFRRLGVLCGWTMGRSRAAELSARYREIYQRVRRPVPGAVALVRRVAQHARVGMVTNNEYREQEEKLEFLGVRDLVDPLVVSVRERVAKPDPRIFRIALDRARARPRETVMVGDSWTNDVLGARNVGIRPIWFNRFELAPPTRHRVEQLRSFRPASAAELRLYRNELRALRPARPPHGPRASGPR
jgi:HAD superfamily hydrolase (TIGR01549 family)